MNRKNEQDRELFRQANMGYFDRPIEVKNILYNAIYEAVWGDLNPPLSTSLAPPSRHSTQVYLVCHIYRAEGGDTSLKAKGSGRTPQDALHSALIELECQPPF